MSEGHPCLGKASWGLGSSLDTLSFLAWASFTRTFSHPSRVVCSGHVPLSASVSLSGLDGGDQIFFQYDRLGGQNTLTQTKI